MTGVVLRASKITTTRYERERPGELVHVDVKKLGRIPDGGGWRAHGRSEDVRARGIGAPERRDAVADELLCLAGPTPASEFLTAQDARRLPHIGFHTVRHDPLTRIDHDQLGRALSDGRAGLAEIAGYPVDTIAYPHGHFDSRVMAAARKSGFVIGVTCDREAVTPGTDPLALGRYEPPFRGPTGEFAFDLAHTLLISPS